MAAAILCGASVGSAHASTERAEQAVGSHRLVVKHEDGSRTYGSSVEPAISHDGRYIAFRSVDGALADPGEVVDGWQIYLRDRRTGDVTLVSRAIGGGGGTGDSYDPDISADGTLITYASRAPDLVAGDSNGTIDVFLFDTRTSTTTLVSRDPGGGAAAGASFSPVISADGRFVAFGSAAPDLVGGADGPDTDIFRYDVSDQTTTVLSVMPDGGPAYGDSQRPSISADGGTVAFSSGAANLTPEDPSNDINIFVRKVATGVTSLVSVRPDGTPASFSDFAAISANGAVVAFETYATDLGWPDTNHALDVYVRDLAAGTTQLVSRARGGTTGSDYSRQPAVSPDGAVVYFASSADDLVRDHNDLDDVFAFDRATHQTEKITFDRNGHGTDGNSQDPEVSGDGSRIAYASVADDIAGRDRALDYDVFLYRAS